MANWECPHCGNTLANGVAVCGACGKEVKGEGRKNLYTILAVLLVVLGGAALLIFTGLLPNPFAGGGATSALVNGEKITSAEVDQKLDLYKKMSGKSGQPDSTPAADLKRQILNKMVQEKILTTEAARENITVSPQEVADKIAAVKKYLNLPDKDFNAFIESQGMSLAAFEKRTKRDILVSKLIAKGVQEKGLTKEAWIGELNKRAKVEMLTK